MNIQDYKLLQEQNSKPIGNDSMAKKMIKTLKQDSNGTHSGSIAVKRQTPRK